MPTPRPTLDLPAARRLAAEAFVPAGTDGFGLELEWFLRHDDGTVPSPARHRAALAAAEGPLPAGGRVSVEPGGQLELSTAVAGSLPALIEATARDAATLEERVGTLGVRMVGTGLDPTGGRRRVHTPRYEAMAAYFAARGDRTRRLGHLMMCATAALQVNVSLPLGSEGRARWSAAHRLGPLLAAAFANSPVLGPAPTGWASTRLRIWQELEPARTAPVERPGTAPGPGRAWADYALGAPVMLVATGPDRMEPVPGVIPFADWVRRGHRLGYPDAEDLRYHLTTLFPPVRPRGWLELRVLDALGDRHWPVAAAAAVTLLTHPEARAEAVRIADATQLTPGDAARRGVRGPGVAAAAERMLRISAEACADGGAGRIADAVVEWAQRYPARGRSPGDDLLEGGRRVGAATDAVAATGVGS